MDSRATSLKIFLNKEFEEQKINWLAQNIGEVVFVCGPNRDQNDSDNLAQAQFFSGSPEIEITTKNQDDKKIILAMWEKYLTNYRKDRQPKGGPGEGVLNNTYSTVTLIAIGGLSLLCLIAIAVGLYLGSRIF